MAEMPDPHAADPQAYLRDWMTIWQSEMAALATDREAGEIWARLLAPWASLAAAAASPPAPPREPAGSAGAAAPAGAEADRDASAAGLARQLARLHDRMAGLERRIAELEQR